MSEMIGNVSERIEDAAVFTNCYAHQCVDRLGAVLAGEQKVESGAELVEIVIGVGVVAAAAIFIVRTIMDAVNSRAEAAATEINNATWK